MPLGLLDRITGEQTEDSVDTAEFKSIIVDTTNVIKEIKNVAASNHIKATDLSFKLLKVTTYYSDEKSENNLVGEEEAKLFLDDAFLLNPVLKITQHYRVEIFKNDMHNDIHDLPQITLSANKNLTKIVAMVAKSHDVKYSPKLEESIIEDIQIKKIVWNIF